MDHPWNSTIVFLIQISITVVVHPLPSISLAISRLKDVTAMACLILSPRSSSKNISLHTIVHQWRSSIEMAEEYARYLQDPTGSGIDDQERSLWQCRNQQSFGKQCEYSLASGNTFPMAVELQSAVQHDRDDLVQLYGGIVCYTTLICDSGLLCLDWRDICDGVQQCLFGYDEENCDKLEFNECEEDEYRCLNGMCIPEQFFLDSDYECSDFSDEREVFDAKSCTFEAASVLCDDRSCPPNTWSCGDGQCLVDRLAFESEDEVKKRCESERDQYYICERNSIRRLWTLANGRCYMPYSDHPVPTQPDFRWVFRTLDLGFRCPSEAHIDCSE